MTKDKHRKMTVTFDSSVNLASFLVNLTKKSFEEHGAKVVEVSLQ